MYPVDNIASRLNEIVIVLTAIRDKATSTKASVDVTHLDSAIYFISQAMKIFEDDKEQKSKIITQDIINEYPLNSEHNNVKIYS